MNKERYTASFEAIKPYIFSNCMEKPITLCILRTVSQISVMIISDI